LLSDGSVPCWGDNYYGELGYGHKQNVGDDELPSSVGPVSLGAASGVTVTQIAIGFRHNCALFSDRSVKCWGDNEYGQLGIGNTETIGDDELPSSIGPVSITTARGVSVTRLEAGGFHTCALLSDGSAKCWGRGDYGQLGTASAENVGDDELPSSAASASVARGRGVTITALAAGGHHTCALLSNGSVRCWGNNLWGQLGTGNTDNIGDDELPSSVAPISISLTPQVTVRKLGLGRVHTCALLSDSSVHCWGNDDHGQLGYGNNDEIGDDELPSSVGAVAVF
jgi:alpha-tubulin suppressor-like RCC1 family protein